MQIPADSLRAALDSVFHSPAYEWREESGTSATVIRWWQALIDWIGGLREASPLMFRILVVLLVVVLLLVLGHALWILLRTVRGAAAVADDTAVSAAAERRGAAWYLRAADSSAAAGRFAEALQLAFVGLALTLDARGMLRYHPGKTPAECAREARVGPADGERLRELVRTLYSCAFGGADCGAEEYRAWRARAGEEWHAPAH